MVGTYRYSLCCIPLLLQVQGPRGDTSWYPENNLVDSAAVALMPSASVTPLPLSGNFPTPASTPAMRRRPVEGDVVCLQPGQAGGSVLATGEEGTLQADDHSDRPFKVVGPRGNTCWFKDGEVCFLRSSQVLRPVSASAVGEPARPASNDHAPVGVARSSASDVASPRGQAVLLSQSRIPVGSSVRLADGQPSGDKLRIDDTGILIADDGSERPYQVRLCTVVTLVATTQRVDIMYTIVNRRSFVREPMAIFGSQQPRFNLLQVRT